VRYTANPAGVVAVNMLQSASNLESKMFTGLVAEIECRPRFMEAADKSVSKWPDTKSGSRGPDCPRGPAPDAQLQLHSFITTVAQQVNRG